MACVGNSHYFVGNACSKMLVIPATSMLIINYWRGTAASYVHFLYSQQVEEPVFLRGNVGQIFVHCFGVLFQSLIFNYLGLFYQ